ncbi:hypothetical protein PTW37_15660 [Arthrobacter agilis]|uniref:hypothetical protein n=1 Tax=Arthrobacter agilis TaxID=37921 RepID=UPI00236693D4|nr:hypothetical protein [Arthrobacter agilis]WDF33264.1 hypothetical protein PTW37_15660 [Arthrobacter agilis]
MAEPAVRGNALDSQIRRLQEAPGGVETLRPAIPWRRTSWRPSVGLRGGPA